MICSELHSEPPNFDDYEDSDLRAAGCMLRRNVPRDFHFPRTLCLISALEDADRARCRDNAKLHSYHLEMVWDALTDGRAFFARRVGRALAISEATKTERRLCSFAMLPVRF